MSFTPTAPYTLTTYSADPSTAGALAYKTAIDQNMSVFQRLGGNFTVSELTTSTRDMRVRVAPGYLLVGTLLTEVDVQVSSTIAPPSAAPRIDRVVLDAITGAVSIVTGVEAAAPTAPAIPSGKIPVARLSLAPDLTAIGNSMLSDERAVWGSANMPLPADYQEFTSTGVSSWGRPIGCSTNSLTQFLLWGAGGGGRSSTAVSAAGAGAACLFGALPTAQLSTAVSVTIGAGAVNTAGQDSLFGSFTAYGGSAGQSGNGGGGGGTLSAGGAGIGGTPRDGNNTEGYPYGGGSGAINGSRIATPSVFGGGGGGDSAGGATYQTGGNSIYGGGGGGGGTGGLGGASVVGGNGGAAGSAGSAPGGGGGGRGGGNAQAGGRGELRVWTWR